MSVVVAHGSGLDELMIFVFPVVMGLGFWIVTRRKPDEDETEDDSTEPG